MNKVYVIRSRIDRYYHFPYIGIYTSYEAADNYAKELQSQYPDQMPGLVAEIFEVVLNTPLVPK